MSNQEQENIRAFFWMPLLKNMIAKRGYQWTKGYIDERLKEAKSEAEKEGAGHK